MNVSVVIILYNPTASDLENVSRFSRAYPGVVVDNSSVPSFPEATMGLMTYLCLHRNMGIAAAQNAALRLLLASPQTEYIVFLDQDTRASDHYPTDIANEFLEAEASIPEGTAGLSLIGPTVIHKETGEAYKSVIHKDRMVNPHLILKRHIISSGSCAHRSAFDDVGLFEEGLFIDFVDDEWCWRANKKGYVCGITPLLTINHKIGQREVHIGKHIVTISAPKRYYYQYRNYLLLLRRNYVPRQWKMAYGVKFAARFCYFPILIKGGFKCWKYMLRGIWAAMKAKK